MSPAQTASELRTVVARRAGRDRRVALLAQDPGLVEALQANGCLVLADPSSPEALADFRPEVVVAFDGLAQDGGAGFGVVARAAPGAELLFSCANAASGTALVGALAGGAPGPGQHEAQVRAWLRAAGYAVLSRDLVVDGHRPSGLGADTEAALRALFEQLNPDAAADRFLYLARPGPAPEPVARVPGLLSVVVSAGGEVPALEGTLSSLARQPVRPLEVLVASPLDEQALERPLSRLRPEPQLTLHAVREPSADWAARANAGLARARGERVAFLEAGDLLPPTHLAQLARALDAGTAAWASTAPPPGPPRLAAWLEHGVHRARWLLDRGRLGAFPLTFAEGVAEAEALLFTRLALLFPPLGVAGAPPVDSPRAPSHGLEAVLAATRARPLRGLTTLEALLRPPGRSGAHPPGALRRVLGALTGDR